MKCAVHAALGALALTCAVYNLAAYLTRREAHLARNVGIYGVIVGIELVQIQHHWRARL